MNRKCFLLVGIFLANGYSAGLCEEARVICREQRRFPAAEAHQGVAVSEKHFFAISNRTIGKYVKQDGKLVARWQPPDGSLLRHLNSGVVVNGKLYCAHSTWPANPCENSIEIWDANSMEHVGRQKLKETAAAVTWVDRHDGHWWIVFAHYGDEASVRKTTLVKLDDQWKPLASWQFPIEVVRRFVPFSNSGGSWGPDGLLYATGHDREEMYALRIPERGSTLALAAIVPISVAGQGIAWDRTDLGIVYGIRRKSKEVVVSRLSHTQEYEKLKQQVSWKRDPRNPILPPSKSDFDSTRCMNPWVLRVGEQYHLYYSGGDAGGRQRICLATANEKDLADWKRHAPLFGTGKDGAFDARWCVLPHVVRMSDERWHLYYTGNAGRGAGLSAFPGIGLATSRDGETWKRFAGNPVLQRSARPGDPDAIGIAGGSVVRVKLPEGKIEWRFYYTGCPTIGAPLPLNQQKTICLAVSSDGVNWQKRGAVMFRDPGRDYENIGVAGPVVHQNGDGAFRMWYSAIGTRWGYYSICYAESHDGIRWRRGPNKGDNLQLAPQGNGWERQMVEYPSIIREGNRLRMFYCGNSYGRTGIGTAVSVEPDNSTN